MTEITGGGGHVFISYVREDSVRVDWLQEVLELAGLRTWRDTAQLWPGQDWREKIRRAIAGDALVFLACFSHASGSRTTSYQNEELAQAIEQLRLRPQDGPWLIPVRFDDCQIPDRDVGAGRTLNSIQRADLFGDNDLRNAERLVAVILRIFGQPALPSLARAPAARDIGEATRLGLPPTTDLFAYYAEQVRLWKQDPAWSHAVLRLVATMAVAREPLPVTVLAELAGRLDAGAARQWCNGTARPLLSVIRPGAGEAPRYGIYHASFREFVMSWPTDPRAESGGPSHEFEALADELRLAVRAAHSRIADRYLSVFGSINSGLATLAAAPDLAGADGGYGLRWLPHHLLSAGREGELHKLLACSSHGHNVWFRAHDYAGDLATYLHAVSTARNAATKLPTQLRYVLADASIAQLSTRLTPVLLGEFVRRNLWSPSRALRYIERMTDEPRQAQALAAISGGESLAGDFCAEALALGLRLPDSRDRARVLEALIPRLPGYIMEPQLDVILSAAGNCYRQGSPGPLVAAANRLQGEATEDLLVRAEVSDPLASVVVTFFRSDERVRAARDALAMAAPPDRGFPEADTLLAVLLPYVPAEAFDAVFEAVRRIHLGDPELLRQLARHAPAERLGDIGDIAEAAGWPYHVYGDEITRRSGEPRPVNIFAPRPADVGSRYASTQARDADLHEIASRMSIWKTDAEAAAPSLAQLASLSADDIDTIFGVLERSQPLTWWPMSGLQFADLLAPGAPDEILERIRERVTGSLIEESCFAAIAALSQYQHAGARRKTAERALALAAAIANPKRKALAVAELSPLLIPGDLAALAFGILDDVGLYAGVRAKDTLAGSLDTAHLVRTLEETCYFEPSEAILQIPRTLARLAAYGRADLIDKVLPKASEPKKVLRIVPLLTESQADRIWRTRGETLTKDQAESLAALVGRFPEDQRGTRTDEILNDYPQGFGDEQGARILAALARTATTEQLTRTLRDLLKPGHLVVLPILGELAPSLPRSLVDQAFRYAMSRRHHEDSCAELTVLAPRLSGPQAEQAIAHVLSTHCHPYTEARAMATLAAHLSGDADKRDQLLAAALDKRPQPEVLADIIPHLPARLRSQAIDQALTGLCFRPRSQDALYPAELDTARKLFAVLHGTELKTAYQHIEQDAGHPRPRAQLLAAVLQRSSDEPEANPLTEHHSLHSSWPDGLDRAETMKLLAAAAWWIEKDSNTSADETVDAIYDVVTWWP